MLTPRQKEIAILIAEGLRNPQIATKLKLSEKTVKAHRTAIYKILDVQGAALVTRYVIRAGWIQP